MQCSYFDAGVCRSCTLMGQSYADQVSAKEVRCRELLAGHESITWLPPIESAPEGFRNKAKMVVGGTAAEPTFGILDGRGRGVDLRECGLYTAGIRDALGVIAEFVRSVRIEPYDVPARRGDLKYVLITEASDGGLMVRFVIRNEWIVSRLRKKLPELLQSLPAVRVVSVNLHPEHKAVVEGEREIVLTERDALTMPVGDLDLFLRPQSFFQTNTEVARQLYEQVRTWVDRVGPTVVWDLYCGVGGFALSCASPERNVVGIEVSVEAIESAKRSAALRGLDGVRFEAGDATEFAEASDMAPDLVIVNPPRRGIGMPLADWLEKSDVPTVVYSSCNPVTLAKDLERMPSYAVREARLLDMFPQTRHLEVVTLLQRR